MSAASRAANRIKQKENYGYSVYLVRVLSHQDQDFYCLDKGIYVFAGCRSLCLTNGEAKRHWEHRCVQYDYDGEDGHIQHIRTRARNMLKLLPVLKRRARRYGWIKPAKRNLKR